MVASPEDMFSPDVIECSVLILSVHNMSIQKQTLRANNKALAQNLAKVKLEVRRLQKENTELESQNQETQHELRRLKRVVGIKDAEIEEEVQRRIQVSIQIGQRPDMVYLPPPQGEFCRPWFS